MSFDYHQPQPEDYKSVEAFIEDYDAWERALDDYVEDYHEEYLLNR